MAGLANAMVARYFPGAERSTETDALLAKLDAQLQKMYEGRVATIYMFGKKVVKDPEKPERFLGNAVDVARLFLAHGLVTGDGTIIAYDPDHPSIQNAQTRLTAEIHELFFPKTLMAKAEAEQFERQKANILRFLSESSGPFPEGQYICQQIGKRYNENILPLTLPEAAANPADRQMQDIFAIMQRNAFDGIRRVLHDTLTIALGPDYDAVIEGMQATRPQTAGANSGKSAPAKRPEGPVG